jgi:Firmicute plasmid replication protein (RepL)
MKKQVRTAQRRVVSKGVSTFANTATGELFQATETVVGIGDMDYAKFWVANILAAVDEIGNAKMRVLWYIIKNIDPMTNMLMQTGDEIARGAKASKRTVIDTLRVLREHEIIARKIGVVMMNPNVLVRGSAGKRMALVVRFEQLALPGVVEDSATDEAEQLSLTA